MVTPLLRPAADLTLGGTVVAASEGDVSLDSGRVPYATAQVTLPLVSEAMIEAMDPRDDMRGVIQLRDDAAGTARAFDLGVRSREVDHRARTITVEFASDEALLMDYAPLIVDNGARAHEGSLRAVVDYVLDSIGASLAPGADDADVTAHWTVTNRVYNPACEGTWGYSLGLNAAFLGLGTGGVVGTKFVWWQSQAAGWSYCIADGEDRVTPGQWLTGVAWLTASDGAVNGYAVARFFDAEGNIMVDIPGAPVTALSGTFKRAQVITRVPPGASRVKLVAGFFATAPNQTLGWDGTMLYDGNEIIPYFDGDTPDDVDYEYSWSGIGYASPSTRSPLVERLPELFVWNPGVTAWEFLEPLTSMAGLRLFCDEHRVWRLVDPATYLVDGLLSIAGWNSTSGTDRLSREDPNLFCTGVVVIYRWEDDNGIRREAHDAAGEPGRVLKWEYDRPYPGPGAAAAILARRAGLGRVQDFTALADLTATPAMETSVSLPGTVDQVGRLQSISWGLSDGLMTGGTLQLMDAAPDSWLGIDADLDWLDVDADLDWEDA